jgi:hypothetical protein
LVLGFFETASYSVAQAGVELKILLSQPPECWDYKHAPKCLAELPIWEVSPSDSHWCGFYTPLFSVLISKLSLDISVAARSVGGKVCSLSVSHQYELHPHYNLGHRCIPTPMGYTPFYQKLLIKSDKSSNTAFFLNGIG